MGGRSKLIHLLISAAGIFFLLLFGFYALLYIFQERLLFFPEKLATDFEFNYSEKFVEGNLSLPSGPSINYLVFNPDSSRGAILYFHGNAGSLRDWGNAALEIAQQSGWSVWIMDYPGFGKSSGSLPKSESVLLEMGRTFWNEIQRTKPGLRVALFGRSIGSGVATNLAVEKNPAALILETPYRSLAKLGHEVYPIVPEFFSRFDLDNEKLIPSLNEMPLLILHGTQDELIPFKHGEILSRLKPGSKFVLIEGGGHNNLSAYPDYWPALTAFLKKIEQTAVK